MFRIGILVILQALLLSCNLATSTNQRTPANTGNTSKNVLEKRVVELIKSFDIGDYKDREEVIAELKKLGEPAIQLLSRFDKEPIPTWGINYTSKVVREIKKYVTLSNFKGGDIVNGLQMTICTETERDVYSSGEEIILLCKIKNVGTQPCLISEETPPNVSTVAGDAIILKARGRIAECGINLVDGGRVELAVGESFIREINLKDDLNSMGLEEGKLEVQVKYGMKPANLLSNKVNFKIGKN